MSGTESDTEEEKRDKAPAVRAVEELQGTGAKLDFKLERQQHNSITDIEVSPIESVIEVSFSIQDKEDKNRPSGPGEPLT